MAALCYRLAFHLFSEVKRSRVFSVCKLFGGRGPLCLRLWEFSPVSLGYKSVETASDGLLYCVTALHELSAQRHCIACKTFLLCLLFCF